MSEERKQLTLGDLISKVQAVADYQSKVSKEDGEVYYDFGRFYPTSINSWRGDYSHLALNYVAQSNPLKITEFLKLLKDADGHDFVGYKGGTYTAGDYTPLWVAEWGDSGHTAIFDVVKNYEDLVLVTGFETY